MNYYDPCEKCIHKVLDDEIGHFDRTKCVCRLQNCIRNEKYADDTKKEYIERYNSAMEMIHDLTEKWKK